MSGTSAPLTLSTWLARLRNFNDEGFGLWAELAMPFALAFVFFRARTEGWSERMRFIAIAFLFGLSHVLVFRGGAFNHAYWQFYFLPFFAITLGWAGVALTRRYLQVPWQRAAVLVGMGVVAFGLNFPHLYALYHTSRHPAFVLLVPHLLRSLLR